MMLKLFIILIVLPMFWLGTRKSDRELSDLLKRGELSVFKGNVLIALHSYFFYLSFAAMLFSIEFYEADMYSPRAILVKALMLLPFITLIMRGYINLYFRYRKNM